MPEQHWPGYPKWKYHGAQNAKLVKSPKEEADLGHDWSDSYIVRNYPKAKYRESDVEFKDVRIVESEAEEKELGEGWFDSPAEYGIETTPGRRPDKKIAAIADQRSKAAEKPARGRPPKEQAG